MTPEMFDAMRRGVCFFFSSPSLPPAPPPPPKRDDPAIAEAKKKQRLSELARKGRASQILAGELEDDPKLSQPQALGT